MTVNSTVRARAEGNGMLEIKNLTVSIEDKLILDNLSLSVNAGEVAAIMGPNGSGKSTLAYVMAGKPAYEVTSGEILLDGENLLELRAKRARAEGIVSGVPVSDRDSGCRRDDVSQGGVERTAAGARRKRSHHAGLYAARA